MDAYREIEFYNRQDCCAEARRARQEAQFWHLTDEDAVALEERIKTQLREKINE